MKIVDPSSLVSDKLIEYCADLPIIIVIGPSKSGKVTIARKISENTGATLYIADEYIDTYGYDKALDYFKQDFLQAYYYGQKAIFEGILSYRLLRQLSREGDVLPSLVIKTVCSDETISYFYEKEENQKSLNRVLSFNRGLDKIFDEFLQILKYKNKTIKLVTLNTSIF